MASKNYIAARKDKWPFPTYLDSNEACKHIIIEYIGERAKKLKLTDWWGIHSIAFDLVNSNYYGIIVPLKEDGD